IMVEQSLQLRGYLVTGVVGVPRLVIAYLGSGTTTLTRSFAGSLVAPLGDIVLESTARDVYGSFVGRTVSVRPDVIVHLGAPQAASLPPGPAESCDDGSWNQNETGVDCGGVCSPCD